MANNEEQFESMSLGDHLEELRLRIFLALGGLAVGTVISLFFSKYLIAFLTSPYERVMVALGEEPYLNFFSPAEGFMIYLRIALISGVIIASPWIIYQIWLFVASGLYNNEKKLVYKAVPLCTVLFIMGCLFCLFVAAPVTLDFFIRFNKYFYENARSNFKFQDYINYVIGLVLVFGIAFQTPVVVLILNWTGLVTVKVLGSWRKYVLLAVFIIAAVLTPPGPVVQLALAVPMYLLYELGLLLCLLRKKGEEKVEIAKKQ